MRKALLGGSALAFIAIAGCSDERAITTEPVGDVAYGQNLNKLVTSLPRGRVGFPNRIVAAANPATDSLWIDFAGLDTLENAWYTVWLGNDSATKFVKLTYNLRVTVVDTVINEAGDPVFTPTVTNLTNVSAFKNGGTNKTFRLSLNRTQMPGLAAGDSANLVLFTMEDSENATEPGTKRFLWARRNEATIATTGTPAVVSTTISGLRFGNYAPRPLDAYVYSVGSTAANPGIATSANIPRGRVEVRGPVFTVNDSNYYRPPVGYYYQAWAIRIDDFGRFADTISLGEKASPFPRRISFRDADISIPDAEYMRTGEIAPCIPTATNSSCPGRQPVIFASQHRVTADTIAAAKVDGGPWKGFAWVYVTLQNKASPSPSTRMGSTVLMSSNLPGSISGL